MARLFNGTSDTVSGSIPAALTGDWTMALWFLVTAHVDTITNAVFATGGASSAGDQRIGMSHTSGTTTIVALQDLATTDASVTTPGSQVALNTWYCVVASFRLSDRIVRLYLGTATTDFTLYTSSAGTGAMTSTGTGIAVGNAPAGSPWGAPAAVAEALLIEREWTDTDRQAYRRGRRPPYETASRFFAPLNEPANAHDHWNRAALTVTGAVVHAHPPIGFGWG